MHASLVIMVMAMTRRQVPHARRVSRMPLRQALYSGSLRTPLHSVSNHLVTCCLQAAEVVAMDLQLAEQAAEHAAEMAALRSLEAQLAERDAELRSLDAQLAEREAETRSLDAQLAERDAELAAVRACCTSLEVQLAEEAAEMAAVRARHTLLDAQPAAARLLPALHCADPVVQTAHHVQAFTGPWLGFACMASPLED